MAKQVKSCPFCETLNMCKSFNKKNAESCFKYKYKAVLKEETYLNRSLRATVRHGSFKLNYCPTCGKSLKEALKHGDPIPAEASGEI